MMENPIFFQVKLIDSSRTIVYFDDVDAVLWMQIYEKINEYIVWLTSHVKDEVI